MMSCSFMAASKINVLDHKCRAAGYNKDYVARFQSYPTFLNCPRRLLVRFPNLTSLKCQSILPVLPPVAATPDSHSQASETVVDQQDQLSTVRVKFQLQKDCGFGDHFLMVGDDPLIGSWDPENAITLDWSDGHMWTAEVDIPVDKTIQFKFILKRRTGDLIWQPSPDRMFKTWTTNNMITVVEDWENAELQKIVEDVTPTHGEEQLLKNSNIVQSAVDELEKESANGMMVAHNIVSDQDFNLADPVLVPGLEPSMSNQSTNGSPLAIKEENGDLNGSIRSRNSKDQTALESWSNLMVESEEVKVKLQQREETQENFQGERGEPDSVIKQQKLNLELKEKEKTSAMSKRKEKIKMKFNDEIEIDNPYLDKVEKQKNTDIQDSYRVLKNDIHWCRKTLQNLLACFRLC